VCQLRHARHRCCVACVRLVLRCTYIFCARPPRHFFAAFPGCRRARSTPSRCVRAGARPQGWCSSDVSSVSPPPPPKCALPLHSQVVAEHDRHARAASGLVQGVEEGLAQITAAGEEAGLAAAAGLQVEGAGQCMDMEEDRAGQVRLPGRHFTCVAWHVLGLYGQQQAPCSVTGGPAG
jgi:hypothetical protein